MAASLDLLLPLGADPYDPDEQTQVRAAVQEGLVDGLWVRDLPCTPAGDPDVGQGGDPFAHLAYLAGAGLTPQVCRIGTASVILGLRHPLVVARAVAGLQAQAGCPVVLGVGTGGKPELNDAVGVTGRTMAEFTRQWRALRQALHDPGEAPHTSFAAPPDHRPPPMHLATSDPARWEAIEGRAEGWQTFLTTPEEHVRAVEEVRAVSAGPLDVCVRADITLTQDGPRSGMPHVQERGRVTCTLGQLGTLLRTWAQLPVDHLLLSLRAPDPLATLRAVRPPA